MDAFFLPSFLPDEHATDSNVADDADTVCYYLWHRQLQSTFDDTLHFEYMESVVLMVLAAAGLSRRKKDAGIAWVPVFFSGDAT